MKINATNLIACGAAALAMLAGEASSSPAPLPAMQPAATQGLVVYTNAAVDSEGVYLANLLGHLGGQALPAIKVCEAPAFGQALLVPRAHLQQLLREASPELAQQGWSGAERVRVQRRARVLAEAEIRELLTAELQREHVKDRGELELRFIRPWPLMAVPDETFSIRVLDVPATGIASSFIVRFELKTPKETLGPWQMPVQAKVMQEMWVARSNLKRDQLFTDADVIRERRDVLSLREAPFAATEPDGRFEFGEAVMAGNPIYARAVRLRPVVRRGQVIEAELQEGAMRISMKVEALENGIPGQLIRVRNQISRRELRCKVHNEQLVQVIL